MRRHGIAVAFHGSAEAIDLFLAGRADLAGFHVAMGSDPRFRGSDPGFLAKRGSDPGVPAGSLLAVLDPARDAVLPFVERTQGLILPRGNPAGVRSLADLVAQAHLDPIPLHVDHIPWSPKSTNTPP